MRQVAVFNENIEVLAKGRISLSSTVQRFELNKNPITCGLVNCTDACFDGSVEENKDRVLVRKKAFSCNYRDKSIAANAQRRIDEFAVIDKAKYYTLGSEFTGEVVAVGDDVTSLKIGDSVIGNGNYPFSKYKNAKPGLPTNHGSMEYEKFHFSKLVKVPSTMPAEVAASFPIGGQTVYSMIRRLELIDNAKVLVTAATSNTSMFAITALKNLNVNVFALTTSTNASEQLKELGADEVFVIKRGLSSLTEDENILNFVKKYGAFDAVIDPFFDIYLGQVVDVLSTGGRYITCGMYNQRFIADEDVVKTLPANFMHVMQNVLVKNIRIIGNCIGSTEDLENAVRDYALGKLTVVIDSVFEGENVAAFFDRSFNDQERFGKVVYKY